MGRTRRNKWEGEGLSPDTMFRGNPDTTVSHTLVPCYSPLIRLSSDLGVDFDATCHGFFAAVDPRSHGPTRGHRLRHRPATRPPCEHGPRPDTTRPPGGVGKLPRRVAA